MLASLLLSALGGIAQHQKTATNNDLDSNVLLTKLKSLVGTWKGTFQWTGEINANGKNTVEYYLTGNGSSLVENIIVEDGTISMSSVYYPDGPSLKMTHFCAANNHPRLEAIIDAKKPESIRFKKFDITNLRHEKAGHVHEILLEFLDKNHLNITFHYIRDGKKSKEQITLERQQS